MRRIWPFRHIGLKLLSLAMALLLWLVVSGEETVERGLRIPLELQQFPANLELQSEPPANVDVRVRGSSGALSRISAGDVIAVLDLHGATAGRRLFRITPEQVRVPFGVAVVQVNPASVALVFEQSVARQVMVTPDVEGKPAPGFMLGKVTVDPALVDIVGPESSVKRVAEAITESVMIAGARDTVTETVAVGLQDPAVRLRAPRPATVTVQIVPAPVQRTFHDIPIRLRNIGSGLSAQALPSAVEAHLMGSREGLNRLNLDDIGVWVDLAGLGAGQYTLAVRGEVGGEASVTRLDPATVQVRIASGRN
jgi:YbbR domain-containing protein